MKIYKRHCLTIGLLILFVQTCWSQNWTQWRGPKRDAVVTDFKTPTQWPSDLKKQWRVSAGAGISSPVVSAERIFLFTRTGDDEVVSCLDLENGAVLWRQSYSAPFHANPQAKSPRLFPASKGQGPFSTPVLYENRLFTLGISRIVSSFESKTGALVWQKQFFKQELPETVTYRCAPCDCSEDDKTFDAPGKCPGCNMQLGPIGLETTEVTTGNYYGAVSSPLIEGNMVIFHVGNSNKSSFIAFDLQSGEEKWTCKAQGLAASSPIMADLHGTRQLITLTRFSVVGVSATHGELLWSFPLESDAQIVTPVVFEDLIIFAIYRGPSMAIKVSKKGEIWSAEEAWKNSKMTVWTSSFVLDGGQLYGFFYSKRGQWGSLDARTGKTIWTSEGRQGLAAAMLDAGDALIALKDDATLIVLIKGDAFAPLAQYSVSEHPTWAYPIVWNNNILIKDEFDLTLWRVE